MGFIPDTSASASWSLHPSDAVLHRHHAEISASRTPPQPERQVAAATTNVSLTQAFVTAGREPHEKRDILRQLIRSAKDLQNAIIFCNRKREVALLYKSLDKHGFSVGALHGDMDQSARTAALDQFRKGEIPLLVASDVAARGLDIPDVSHVFNFDVPHHADDYVHRIGRTGRAGGPAAISIVRRSIKSRRPSKS